MKSLLNLFAAVLRDCAVECHTDPSGDIEKCSRRFEEEGLSFFALTLPLLAEALERGLRTGTFDLTDLSGFARKAGLPLMFGGFLRQIFDTSGKLLDTPSVAAIASIRQICLMWKKIQLPCSKERELKAVEAYIQADKEIPEDDIFDEANRGLSKTFSFVTRYIWATVLADVDSLASARATIPKHGPGTTAEKIRGNAKYLLRSWHERLEPFFPYDHFGVVNPAWCLEESLMSNVSFLSPGDEPPVRVLLVPKTLKGPRVIAAEPIAMQYAQQSLLGPLVKALESHSLLGGRIGFTDQSKNQDLALSSSLDGRFATLDLKEASDRVPLWGVARMLEGIPNFRDAVMACRSTRALLPDGRVLPLRKFASMGSADCFPIEAMFFFSIIVAGRMHGRSLPLKVSSIKRMINDIHVYGDDIIVPVDEVYAVISSLEAFGLKVNSQKSFWTGKFRESCGMDAYDGHRITPVYVRRMPPTSAGDAQSILSWVSLANQLYFAGLWGASGFCRNVVEDLLGRLPSVDREAGCLGWHSVRDTVSIQGWSKTLQKPMVRSYTTRTVWRNDLLSEHAALMKCLLPKDLDSVPDRLGYLSPLERDSRHLERSSRSVVLSTRRRWASPT